MVRHRRRGMFRGAAEEAVWQTRTPSEGQPVPGAGEDVVVAQSGEFPLPVEDSDPATGAERWADRTAEQKWETARTARDPDRWRTQNVRPNPLAVRC